MNTDGAGYVLVHFGKDFAACENKEDLLRVYFQNKTLTNGGEISSFNIPTGKNTAFIHFKEKGVAESVAQKGSLVISPFSKFDIKLGQKDHGKKNKPPSTPTPSVTPNILPLSNNNPSAMNQLHIFKRSIIIDGNNVAIGWVIILKEINFLNQFYLKFFS
jgi:hypothetical protein